MEEPNYNYKIIWFNNDDDQRVCITNKNIWIENRCAAHYPIDPKEIRDLSKCLPDTKIMFAYHNPKGDDLVIYENGLVNHIGYGTKVGRLFKIEKW
jgi:hypothetical protein